MVVEPRPNMVGDDKEPTRGKRGEGGKRSIARPKTASHRPVVLAGNTGGSSNKPYERASTGKGQQRRRRRGRRRTKTRERKTKRKKVKRRRNPQKTKRQRTKPKKS